MNVNACAQPESAPALTPQALASLNQRYLQCLQAHDWAGGKALALQALQAMPEHPEILGDLALCQMRGGELDAALHSFGRVLALSPNEPNPHDGLAELHGLRAEALARGEALADGRDAATERELARAHGLLALALKDTRHALPLLWPLPAQAPPPLSDERRRNVLAYSLFGDNPRYGETMVLNVQAAQSLMPQWTVRVYTDASVPQGLRQRLAQGGAELVLCDGPQWQGIPPLMWRFAVMHDTQVQRWLIRDADSLLSTREQAAVQAWLDSACWFHMLRDYYTHTELLLAGLLGGCGGVFTNAPGQPDWLAQMRAFAAAHQHEQRVVDQHFLRQQVWPTVRGSLLTHDSWFGFMQAQPFPAHAPHGLGGRFHVGCNLASAAIGVDNTQRPDGEVLRWQLFDEQGAEVCAYDVTVRAGRWRAQLPQPYIDKLRTQAWRVVCPAEA